MTKIKIQTEFIIEEKDKEIFLQRLSKKLIKMEKYPEFQSCKLEFSQDKDNQDYF